MNVFAQLERICAEFVERSFARIFPSQLEPVQIARRLIARLEAVTPPPTRYTVFLHPYDYEAFAPELPELQSSWSEMLSEMAQRLHLSLAETPVILVKGHKQIVLGSLRVDAAPGEAVVGIRVVHGIPQNARVLVRDQLVVGRAPESGLVLFDPSISRRHGEFVVQGVTVQYRDLGSTNGSFVKGRRVERATLRSGDTLMLGDCELRIE